VLSQIGIVQHFCSFPKGIRPQVGGVGPRRCAPLGQQNGTSLVQKLCACICIRLKRCTIQHGRSDQICSYSETVGPDWSGMRTSRTYLPTPSTYARCGCEPKTGRSIDRASTYLEVCDRAGPISSIHTVKQ
jgi:hypothetical protein